MTWIDIKERMPETYNLVLIYVKYYGDYLMYVAELDNDNKWHTVPEAASDCDLQLDHVLYWKKLSIPKKEYIARLPLWRN